MLELVPEQLEGARFLADRRVALLGDKVGFGKSAQFVRACDAIDAETITIICPPALRTNERDEFDKFCLWGPGARPVTIIKTGADDVPATGIVIATYNLIARSKPMAAKLAKRKADVLILDESHRVKDPTSEAAKALFYAKGIASRASRVWFVSGTPVENHAGEFFVFAKCCGAWKGTHREFMERYTVETVDDFGKRTVVANQNEGELLASLAPYVLARDKVDPNRPPLTVDEFALEGRVPKFPGVTDAELDAIRAAAEAGDWSALDGDVSSRVQRLVGAAKAEAAADLIITELDGGVRKAIAFCYHTETIDLIRFNLLGRGVAVFDGRTPDDEREAIKADIQNPNGTIRVLIAHRQAVGEGLTLTGADRVYMVEPAWNPKRNEQCIARAWRRGQTRPVRASFLYLPGSIDEAVLRVLARKERENAKVSLSRSV